MAQKVILPYLMPSQIREKNHLVVRQGGFWVGDAQFSNLTPLYAEIQTYFEQNP